MTNRRKPHAAIRARNRRVALAIAGLCLSVAVLIALAFGYGALKRIWNAQTCVENSDADIVIETGEMVPKDAVRFFFGLTNGAVIANIDFAARRAEFLKKVANVRDMRIEKCLPNRLTIVVEERRPIVCLLPPGRKQRQDGRVADAEGVVFQHRRSAAELPIVRDDANKPTETGGTLKGMQAAAIELVTTLAKRVSTPLKVLDVDTSRPDYLLVTLGDYSNVKLAWERMEERSRTSHASLEKQLTRLEQVIQSNVAPGTVLWNAINWKQGRIYAGSPTATRNKEQ